MTKHICFLNKHIFRNKYYNKKWKEGRGEEAREGEQKIKIKASYLDNFKLAKWREILGKQFTSKNKSKISDTVKAMVEKAMHLTGNGGKGFDFK